MHLVLVRLDVRERWIIGDRRGEGSGDRVNKMVIKVARGYRKDEGYGETGSDRGEDRDSEGPREVAREVVIMERVRWTMNEERKLSM